MNPVLWVPYQSVNHLNHRMVVGSTGAGRRGGSRRQKDVLMNSSKDNPPPAIRKVLCIDGGGIKGVQPAAFLATLEKDLDHPVGAYFDLIAGTSTGGILALGLALGHTAAELLELYEQRGPVIFGQPSADAPPPGFFRRLLSNGRHASRPKHDAEVLREELSGVLGGALIGDAKTRLVIPAWDADRRCPYVYKTAHHERFSTDYRHSALDAAMATAAAPSYFKRHRTVDDVGLLDGGVWANNPIAVATVEAVNCLNWPASGLRILSLGCTDDLYLLPEEPGYLRLRRDLLNLFGDGQSHGALGMAKLLTGHPYSGEKIFRYAPTVPASVFQMDDPSKVKQLKGLGASAARSAKPHLSIFLHAPAEPFVPFHEMEGAAA